MELTKKQTIINQALNLPKKPSKRDIELLILDLLDSTDDVINIDQLTNLYAHFLPAKQKATKVDQWLTKALGKDKFRPYLSNLHVRDGILGATDGHRMHFIHTELADGNYQPKTMTPITREHDTFRDLNIKQVIPTHEDYTTIYKVIDRGEMVDKKGKKLYNTVTMDIDGTKAKFNEKYLLEAGIPMISDGTVSLSIQDSYEPLLMRREIDGQDVYAVIMPLRID